MSEGRHGPLGIEIDEAQHRSDIQEGEDMHTMHDHLHARGPGCDAAHDPGLAFVRVHQLRPDAPEEPPQLEGR